MSFLEICKWLQHLGWATAIRESTLAFPIIEGSHVLSLSISIGIVIFLDLRLLRLTFRETPISRIMKAIGPWMIGGMFVMVFTGILLFCAQATSAYMNIFFRIKMLLLVAGALNAGYYQWRYYPYMADWDLSDRVPIGAKVIAVLSIVFWFGVIVCGRTMEYEI